MVRSELLDQIKSRLTNVYGKRLRGVVLYGSEARGEAREDSDIDVLVLLDAPIDFGNELRTVIEALYPLQLELDRVLEAFPVSDSEYRQAGAGFLKRAREQGVVV